MPKREEIAPIYEHVHIKLRKYTNVPCRTKLCQTKTEKGCRPNTHSSDYKPHIDAAACTQYYSDDKLC